STIAGTVARLLGRAGDNVLALDVDTLPGLSVSLGLQNAPDSTLPDDLAERREGEGWAMKDPGIRAFDLVDRYAQHAPDRVKLLQVGKLPGPIPQARNTTFRHVLDTFDEPGWSVVVDLAAGVRQASYGWAFSATRLAIVIEPTQASAMTARRLRKIAETRSDLRVGVILNKQRGDPAVHATDISTGLPIWARLPYSEEVIQAERQGVALLDVAAESPVIKALTAMIKAFQESDFIGKTA
ncbi:MAG: hypothetical protein M3Z07_04915, partial [Candidatus Eremiobacteraeota bacterium]|nr:hypothetical protein [Candidatus Eremiobacteraeota bacterium]